MNRLAHSTPRPHKLGAARLTITMNAAHGLTKER